MIVFALAAFGCTLPHFIYGDDLLHSTNAFYGGFSDNSATQISTSISSQNTSKMDALISSMKSSPHLNLCHAPNSNFTDASGDKNQ